MLEIKEGKIIHYMNHNNRIMRGKVITKVGRYYKISNSNFLVSPDRIFKNDEQATKFFNLTKGWNIRSLKVSSSNLVIENSVNYKEKL